MTQHSARVRSQHYMLQEYDVTMTHEIRSIDGVSPTLRMKSKVTVFTTHIATAETVASDWFFQYHPNAHLVSIISTWTGCREYNVSERLEFNTREVFQVQD